MTTTLSAGFLLRSVLVFLGILFLQCTGQTPLDNGMIIDHQLPVSYSRSLILFSDLNQIAFKTDRLEIGEIQLTDDLLSISVNYSGGCQIHQFALYGGKGLSKSNPPQVEIYLSHDARSDNCEAYLHRQLDFQLQPLKSHLQSQYPEYHQVLLRIYVPGSDQPFQPLILFTY